MWTELEKHLEDELKTVRQHIAACHRHVNALLDVETKNAKMAAGGRAGDGKTTSDEINVQSPIYRRPSNNARFATPPEQLTRQEEPRLVHSPLYDPDNPDSF